MESEPALPPDQRPARNLGRWDVVVLIGCVVVVAASAWGFAGIRPNWLALGVTVLIVATVFPRFRGWSDRPHG